MKQLYLLIGIAFCGLLFCIFSGSCENDNYSNTTITSTLVSSTTTSFYYQEEVKYTSPSTLNEFPIDLTNSSDYLIIANYDSYLEDENGTPYLNNGLTIGFTQTSSPHDVMAIEEGYVKDITTIRGDPFCGITISPQISGTGKGWLYYHIAENSLTKSIGEHVSKGEKIGELSDWGVEHEPYRYRLHLSRIESKTEEWSIFYLYQIGNPQRFFPDFKDDINPEIGEIYFSRKNGTAYFSPEELYGDIDVVVDVKDKIGLSMESKPYKYVSPYKILWKLSKKGDSTDVFKVTSFVFDGQFIKPVNLSFILRDDDTCDTALTKNQIYYVVSNTDGDGVVESGDNDFSFMTADFDDGDYILTVTAVDYAGNIAYKTVELTINNY